PALPTRTLPTRHSWAVHANPGLLLATSLFSPALPSSRPARPTCLVSRSPRLRRPPRPDLTPQTVSRQPTAPRADYPTPTVSSHRVASRLPPSTPARSRHASSTSHHDPHRSTPERSDYPYRVRTGRSASDRTDSPPLPACSAAQ